MDQLAMHDTYYGVYAGTVDDTTDPRELGRVRVRIFDIYGDDQDTPTDNIPWALPCFPSHSFNPPQVGDSVWVIFQHGSLDYPVYLGYYPSMPMDPVARGRRPDRPSLEYRSGCPSSPRPLKNDSEDAQRRFVASRNGTSVDKVPYSSNSP